MGTFLLLVVLAGWMAVGLWWLTSHRDEPTDAIGSFRRQLGSLERRSPALVAPAHRLNNRSRSQAGVGVGVGDRVPVPPAYRRAAIQKRRRDILSGLALATGGSLMLGFVPALRPMWLITLVSGAMLAGYVYLLVQLRNLRAEREMRTRFAGSAVMQPASIYELDLRDGGNREGREYFASHYPDEDIEYDEEGRVLEPALARSAANW